MDKHYVCRSFSLLFFSFVICFYRESLFKRLLYYWCDDVLFRWIWHNWKLVNNVNTIKRLFFIRFFLLLRALQFSGVSELLLSFDKKINILGSERRVFPIWNVFKLIESSSQLHTIFNPLNLENIILQTKKTFYSKQIETINVYFDFNCKHFMIIQ